MSAPADDAPPWDADHPLVTDERLARWGTGVFELLPGARPLAVLRHLPGRRVALLVEDAGVRRVVKVFHGPRARGNHRRLEALGATDVAGSLPASLGWTAQGHVLGLTWHEGLLPDDLPDERYAGVFEQVGALLRRLHDCGAPLDRAWTLDDEVTQLHRRAVPQTEAAATAAAAAAHALAGTGGDLVVAHRDFHPRQVLVTPAGEVRFIDLDDAALAPRPLDVGNMLAHLTREAVLGRRPDGVVEAARWAFATGYGSAPGLTAAAVQAWEALALARLAALAVTRHDDPAQGHALLARLADRPSQPLRPVPTTDPEQEHP